MQVVNGKFLDWHSLEVLRPLDAALPDHNRHPVPLVRMIDERPLSDFAADQIGRRLSEIGAFVNQAVPVPEPLVGLAPFADPAPVARDVIAQLASLPLDYPASFRLPDRLASPLKPCFDESGRMDIGAGIALVRGGSELASEMPLLGRAVTLMKEARIPLLREYMSRRIASLAPSK